jgi:hypothetical protein
VAISTRCESATATFGCCGRSCYLFFFLRLTVAGTNIATKSAPAADPVATTAENTNISYSIFHLLLNCLSNHKLLRRFTLLLV